MNSTTFSLSSLSQVAGLAKGLPSADADAIKEARARQDDLTKPQGSLGRLEELAVFLAGWQGRDRPAIDLAQAVVFAGNHGVCAQGVNPFPQEVTVQMVANFQAGGAAINQLCAANQAELSVVALDLDTPTADITQAPAMSAQECLEAMNRGAQAVNPQADILLLGEMGIGNSTIAAALACASCGGEAVDWIGPGTGSDAAGMAHKASVVDAALALHPSRDGMDILANLGGREQAAICGAVLAARSYGIAVILDGFICTAAVAPLHVVDPALLDHCLVGHQSAEPGHKRLLAALNKTPIVEFDMRLGEGSGAALALGILRSALACHNGMSTFSEAGVSEA